MEDRTVTRGFREKRHRTLDGSGGVEEAVVGEGERDSVCACTCYYVSLVHGCGRVCLIIFQQNDSEPVM